MGKMVFIEPGTFGKLGTLEMDFTTVVISRETHHEPARVGPRLTAEVTQVLDVKPRFLHHLTMHSLFERLARLHEPGYKTVEIRTEIIGVHQQYLVALAHQHDDSRSQLRPHLLATVLAALGNISMKLHGSATHPTELRILVPVEQFVTLASLAVFLSRQFIVTLAQATHLIARMVHQRLVDAIRLFAIHIHDSSPRLRLHRHFRRNAKAVGCLLQYDVALTKHKIPHSSLLLNSL